MSPFSRRNQQKTSRVIKRMRLRESRFSRSLGAAAGEANMVERPEIPVGEFLIESLVEFRTVQGLLPSVVEFFEILELMSVPEC